MKTTLAPILGFLLIMTLAFSCATSKKEEAGEQKLAQELENWDLEDINWSLDAENTDQDTEQEIIKEGDLARGKHSLFERK